MDFRRLISVEIKRFNDDDDKKRAFIRTLWPEVCRLFYHKHRIAQFIEDLEHKLLGYFLRGIKLFIKLCEEFIELQKDYIDVQLLKFSVLLLGLCCDRNFWIYIGIT